MCRSAPGLLLIAVLPVAAQTDLALMPWPAKIVRGSGKLAIDASFRFALTGGGATDERVRRAMGRLLAPMGVQVAGPPATLVIEVERPKPGVQQYGDDESYRLTVTPQSARLTALEPIGALRGLETFLQLSVNGSVPAVDITDQPRFGWRGLSLDVSRHFLSVAAVKRAIDGLAAVKMNVFHWHLSDDQGFRMESKKFPLLHQKGSDGLYYTQAQVRDVIAYARDRGVRVVPEFDIPGHATSWFAGYPNLASGKGPYRVLKKTGVFAATMDPTRETTYTFLDGFIGEMAALFPDAYFHIGGDEVAPKGEWSRSLAIKAFMRKNKYTSLNTLQAYFNRRVMAIVTKHGKRMEGWDEILYPDLPKSIVIQSWQGQKSLADAAREGYSGILSAGYYLDLMEPAGKHYVVDPLKGETADLNPEQQKLVMGGEAAMWEELATEENIDAKLWPRTAAIAERLWSPGEVNDVAAMYRRLALVSAWLETHGMQHRSQLAFMLKRLAGSHPVAPLATFASILEPVKGYVRHESQPYKSLGGLMALNRLVDSIPPESDTAREFNEAANSPANREVVRKQLTTWRDNVAVVLPILKANKLLVEHVEVANAVAELCTLGLEGKDVARIEELGKAKADVVIQIAPGVRKLVEAPPR
jgi:hexosaminidase